MKRILVVEDEPIIRRSILNMIDWEECGYAIIGEAKNGKEGLEIYQDMQPDIVFTDIRMPLLNGLELIASIKKKQKKPCQFVILTAYDDFDYARAALVHGVKHYLLKHEIDKDSILKVLNEVSDDLKAEKSIFEQKSIPAVERFLKAEATDEEAKKLLDAIGFSFVYRKTFAAQMITDGGEPLREMISKILDTADSVQEYVCMQAGLKRNELIFLVTGKKSLDSGDIINHVVSAIKEEYVGHTIIQYSSPLRDIANLRETVRYMHEHMYDTFFITHTAAYHINQNKELDIGEISLHYDICKKAITLLDTGEFTLNFELLYTELAKFRDKTLFDRYATGLIFHLHRIAEDRGLIQFLPSNDPEALIGEYGKKKTWIEASRWIEEITVEALNSFAAKYSPRIRKVIQYLNTHFGEDIDIADIAELLYVSETHAGRLFKQEVGESLHTYLTNIRIRKAVELLSSGQYLVNEVSDLVGFRSLPYFSETFKSVTGKRPSDYLAGDKHEENSS